MEEAATPVDDGDDDEGAPAAMTSSCNRTATQLPSLKAKRILRCALGSSPAASALSAEPVELNRVSFLLAETTARQGIYFERKTLGRRRAGRR